MDRSRKLLSILLAGLLISANAACACASAGDSVSQSGPHAPHQVESPPCTHEACENCESLSIASSPERDASLASFARLGLDDDVVWTEANAAVIRRPSLILARAGPPLRRPSRWADTPVRRADLLLE